MLHAQMCHSLIPVQIRDQVKDSIVVIRNYMIESGIFIILNVTYAGPPMDRITIFVVILSCYGHEIKQPIEFLVLIRTTDFIGPLIWCNTNQIKFLVLVPTKSHSSFKQPIKFLVLMRTTDLIGPLIW